MRGGRAEKAAAASLATATAEEESGLPDFAASADSVAIKCMTGADQRLDREDEREFKR